MLEKDKNCIEFLMYSIATNHKPCQENTEITITGTSPGHDILFAPNPFDIPCDVVVIPKRDFERLQAENEQLKKKSHEYDHLPEFRELLKKLYSTDDVETLAWTLNHVCGGRGSVNGWIAVSLFWKQNYETLAKLVGFSSVEEIQDYLTNEANCDTLHEAISNLHDEVKYTSDEWNDMDKKLKECEKEVKALRAEVNEFYETFDGCEPAYVKQRIDEMKDEIENLNKKLKFSERTWKSATGCAYPANARILIEKWKLLTKCETPEDAATLITAYKSTCERWNELAEGSEKREKEWQDATGRISPEEAKQYIERLKGRLNKIHDCAVDW